MRLSAMRPSHVKTWTAGLRMEGKQSNDGTLGPLAVSYVYACHARLAQIMSDAVAMLAPHLSRSGEAAPLCRHDRATLGLSDVMPERLGAAVLLRALAGLRLAESCGLRVSDVDFMRGIVFPRMQYPAEELKTEISRTPILVGQSLALQLSAHVKKWSAEASPRASAITTCGTYFASLLIAHGQT